MCPRCLRPIYFTGLDVHPLLPWPCLFPDGLTQWQTSPDLCHCPMFEGTSLGCWRLSLKCPAHADLTGVTT